METIYAFLLALVFALLVWVIVLNTADAGRRGFNRVQIILIRLALLMFFPFGFVFYFLLRPSIKELNGEEKS